MKFKIMFLTTLLFCISCFAQGGLNDELNNTQLMYEGVKAFSSGDYEEATNYFSQVKPTTEKLKFDSGLGLVQSQMELGRIAFLKKDYNKGFEAYNNALEKLKELESLSLTFLPGGSEFFNSFPSWKQNIKMMKKTALIEMWACFNKIAEESETSTEKKEIYLQNKDLAETLDYLYETMSQLGNLVYFDAISSAIINKNFIEASSLIVARKEEATKFQQQLFKPMIEFFNICIELQKDLPQLSEMLNSLNNALSNAKKAKEIPSEVYELINIAEKINSSFPKYFEKFQELLIKRK